MKQVHCPMCGTASSGGQWLGDSEVIICPQCGGYRLAGTAIRELETGALRTPNPVAFRDLVSRRRGRFEQYPLITSADLGV